MVPYSKAKKVKSPTGRPSKAKAGYSAYASGKKSAGKKKSAYSASPKKKKASYKGAGGLANRAAGAIKRRKNR